MQTYTNWIDVRVCLALAAGALLLAWTIGCPPPIHPNNFGGVGDDDDNGDDDDASPDDDATGDDDDIEDDDDDDFNNFAACMDWLDDMECGDTDFSDFVDCNTFAEWPCDLTDYFACLAEETICQGGHADLTGWVNCEDLTLCE